MGREEQGRAYDSLLEAEAQRAKASAAAAVSAGSNHNEAMPAAPIGPAAEVTWIGNPITPRVSGKFRVTACCTVLDTAVDDAIVFQLVRDPTAATGAPGGTRVGPQQEQDSGHVSGHASVSITWIDDVGGPPFAAHKWGITAASGAGNLSINQDQSVVVVEELPG